MNLLEEQKAERRARIVAAARKLIAQHGYDGLSMRTLAERSRVSVPTLYNLFGSKHGILAAEMQATFSDVAGALAAVADGDFVDHAFAMREAALRSLTEAPGYHRELVRVMLTSRETDELRHSIEAQYIAVMTHSLAAGQKAGQLARWVDCEHLARTMYFVFMTAVLGWAKGDLDDEALRHATAFNQCMMLLGVARGAAARRLEEQARKAQRPSKRRR